MQILRGVGLLSANSSSSLGGKADVPDIGTLKQTHIDPPAKAVNNTNTMVMET